MKDVWVTPINDEFTHQICETNDQLTKIVDDSISGNEIINSDIINNFSPTENSNPKKSDDYDGFDYSDEPMSAHSIGDRIEVFWTLCGQ